MEYDQIRAMEKTHVCSMCGGLPVTIWDVEKDCYRLCCGSDHTHNGFQRRLSPQQALQRGKADEVIAPGAQKDLEERVKANKLALTLLPKEDLGNHQSLNLGQIKDLIDFGESVGLNARLGHVCLYYGKPYITIDGYYFKNTTRGEPYAIGTRPANAEERTAYFIEEGWHCFIAEAWQAGVKIPTSGVGIVTADEISEKSARDPGQFRAPVVHSHPARMAEKRAEWQLLRKLIPLEVKE